MTASARASSRAAPSSGAAAAAAPRRRAPARGARLPGRVDARHRPDPARRQLEPAPLRAAPARLGARAADLDRACARRRRRSGSTAPGLHRHPMLYLAGAGAFPPLSEAERAALRRHLQYGGFLLVDAADGSDGGGFDASARRELAQVLPVGAARSPSRASTCSTRASTCSTGRAGACS